MASNEEAQGYIFSKFQQGYIFSFSISMIAKKN